MPSPEDKRAQIMRRYSHLFVECNDDDVQHLYWLLGLFFAKCDGLLSGAEAQKLEDSTGGTATHARFSPYLTPVHQREPILMRLKFLKQYHIKKPEEIIRVLTVGVFAAEKPSASDRKYLVEFTANPDKTLKWFAGRLRVNATSVLRGFKRLKNAIGFRFFSSLNYPLFRLKHFKLYFRPNESFRNSMLSNREITRNLNCDTFGGWMTASFLVANQDRILKEFTGSLREFAGEVFSEHHLYEVKSNGQNHNLSMFDGEKWFFSEEAIGLGAFKYAQANKEIMPRLREFMYGDTPIKFDQVDFLLSLMMSSDSLTKNSELRQVLKESNYGVFSRVTVSKRLTALKRAGVFFPMSYFSGLGLNAALDFTVECDDEIRETFYHMFPMLPDCWAYRTDKGVSGMVRTPAEMASAVSYLLHSLKDEVHNLIVTSRFENIGSRTWRHLVRHWNADEQLWEFEKGFFDLTKGLSEPS